MCVFKGLNIVEKGTGIVPVVVEAFPRPSGETGVGSRRFFVEAEIVCQLPPDDKFFEKCP